MKNNRTDIICLCTHHDIGGAQNNAARLVHAFRSRGYKAELGFLFEQDPDACFLVEDAFVIFPNVPSSAAEWTRFFVRCRKEISGRYPRIIIGFHPLGNIIGALFARLGGGRFISRQAWPASEQSRCTERLESLLMRTSFVSANIAVSRFISASFSHWGSVYARKTTVIYNEPPVLPKVDEPVMLMRKKLDINEGTLVLGCIGRLHEQKNFQLSIRAMAHLPATAHLYVAGGGEQGEMLRQVAAEAGVSARVHFLGVLTGADVTRFYLSVDLLLMPSLYEGHPMVMLEAMSQGVPVLAHDVAVMREAGGEAALYASTDPKDWAHRILALDAQGLRNMAKKSLARAEHFAQASMVDEYLRVAELPSHNGKVA